MKKKAEAVNKYETEEFVPYIWTALQFGKIRELDSFLGNAPNMTHSKKFT